MRRHRRSGGLIGPNLNIVEREAGRDTFRWLELIGAASEPCNCQ
jgi:hypothetical protein